jgi:hypothetical protein
MMIYPLPFGKNERLDWEETRTYEVIAPRAGSLKRLIFDQNADRLLVESICVGTDEQLLDDEDGGVPGQMFAPTAYGMEMASMSSWFSENSVSPPLELPSPQLRFSVRVRAVRKPSGPQSFTVAWWRRWFTREGWWGSRPPRVNAVMMLACPEPLE